MISFGYEGYVCRTMSWNLIILPPEDASDDATLGMAEELRAKLDRALPGLAWAVPDQGVFEGTDLHLRIRLDPHGEIDSFMLAFTGDGEPLPVLLDICRDNEWAVFDSVVGQYLDLADPSDDGWHAYHAHRDGKVIAPDEG